MALESFIGLDAGEPMSEAAFEQLKEKMRAAAAQIAAIKKEEKKQKKKEYDLLKILLEFVRTSQKKDLALLISRVLEINIPANFILAIILLGNEDLKNAAGQYVMLNSDTKAIFFTEDDKAMPLRVRIQLDNWLKDLLSQAEEYPQKLLKTAYKVEYIELEKEYEFEESKYEEKRSIQEPLIQLVTFVVRDFFEQNAISEAFKSISDFAEFVLKGILTKTKEMSENIKLLGN